MVTDPTNQVPNPPQDNNSRRWWSRFWACAKTHVSVEHEIPVGASKVTPRSRIARILFSLISFGCFLFFLDVFASKLWSALQRPPELPSTIAVFLPDPTRYSENAFYQDGAVQKKGFDKAMQDAEDLPNRLKVEFHPMKKEDTAEAIFSTMKNLYATNGGTYFVMTMSGKVGGVRQYFTSWHDRCLRQGKREPVLIATVASAPNLPDASAGILRWYVRSEEESSVLAEYLRWKEAVTNAVVFYICRTAGQSDDAYGSRGMEVFQSRFLALGGASVEAFNVTAGTAKKDVKDFLTRYKSPRDTTATGAFIVGYGDMVKETINELLVQGFGGPIACTSTLTEADWQPQDKAADNRIFTVVPRRIAPQARLRGDDRNVVFFFSKRTLARVLELSATSSDSRKFIERWKVQDEKSDLDQTHLSNGDIVVNLDVVGADQWR